MPLSVFVSGKAAAAVAIGVVAIGAYSGQICPSRRTFAEADEPPKTFGRGLELTSLSLYSAEAVNHNTKCLVFQLPEKNAQSGLPLTSSLLAITRPHGCWFPVVRPYTPISCPDEPGFLVFLVKKYPRGKSSTHLHSLQPGQAVRFFGPLQGYPYIPGRHSHIYLVAGGAGITPIYQLLQGALNNPADKTKMTLIFGVNTEDDLFLREELDALKVRFPERFDVVYAVSSLETDGDSKMKRGRITESLLRQVMRKDSGGRNDVKVLVCGPPAMEDALLGGDGILDQLGYLKEQIFKF